MKAKGRQRPVLRCPPHIPRDPMIATSKKEFCGGIILGSNGKSKVITRVRTDVDTDGCVSERVKGMGLCRASGLCCVAFPAS